MNKLILIGNGFDLAHGLPTSYSGFINDFWENIHLNYKKDEYTEIVFINEGNSLDISPWLERAKDYESLKVNLKQYAEMFKYNYNEDILYSKTGTSSSNTIFKFKNNFFKKICINNSLQNWVDIENEYYKSLKEIAKSSSLEIQEKKKRVTQLNKEFEQVKKLLEKYLAKIVSEYNFNINAINSGHDYYNFHEILQPISFKNIEKTIDEFSNLEDKNELKQLSEKEINDDYKSNLHILNFNYFPTPWYCYGQKSNHIHGFINNKEHTINFGFGDEMDKDYRAIENLDENEFLKYFKSFKYSDTKHYNNLLDFINSEKFQVIIMGHSCGLSDRLLLNTIFEHKYCRSIKVYYHEKDSETDNYTSIVQNISRHFKDKQKMREKIVNKELCRPLPQVQLPFKEPKNNEI